MSPSKAVVWLDRDGTLLDDPGYLDDPARLALLPGAADAVAALNAAGATVVLVTNQSGIGRGLMTEATVDAIHEELRRQLRALGGELDAIYLCPHRPASVLDDDETPCSCRKPAPGLIERARRDLDLEDLPAVVVGDKAADLGLAAAVGVPAVLVLTGEGERTRRALERTDPAPAHVAADLAAAVPWILQTLGLASSGPRC